MQHIVSDSCTSCVDDSCSGCLIPAQLTSKCMGQTKTGITGRSQVGCNAAEPQQNRLCSKLQLKSAGVMLHVLLLTASLSSNHSVYQLQPGVCWMCLNLRLFGRLDLSTQRCAATTLCVCSTPQDTQYMTYLPQIARLKIIC